MADTFDKQKRSSIMSKVHSKDTKPELIVRKLLYSMGYRFRLHRTDLPGKPDIVLPKYHTVIFVHGCFWHGCPSCSHGEKRPQSNVEYWDKKINRNIERDQKNAYLLEGLGWKVLIIWECELKKRNLDVLMEKILLHLQ
ncbi:MAG TPA: very short patch repair endonuclease [Methylomusa anaerophila]|uniref:very short patch repair endonuclease n=1 Tax=Methylomusa anaerophila TaxID=1930071 RepID=UPI000F84A518|nr:very short patch repair endonuclease [Methylomusa anaerophila]HML88955.1 very short patch repair endonuclease [Methylomusa anaerophila]